jgi:hypothetical protein
VLDGEFTEIDEEVIDYLDTLESQKDKYYGTGNLTYLDAYDEVTQKF